MEKQSSYAVKNSKMAENAKEIISCSPIATHISFKRHAIAMDGVFDCHSIIPISFSNGFYVFHLSERMFSIHLEYP